MILLADVLKVMEQRDKRGMSVPFAITYVTDTERKPADSGRIIDIPFATMPGHRTKTNKDNGTINLHTEGGQIRSAHIALITHFNGQRVG